MVCRSYKVFIKAQNPLAPSPQAPPEAVTFVCSMSMTFQRILGRWRKCCSIISFTTMGEKSIFVMLVMPWSYLQVKGKGW